MKNKILYISIFIIIVLGCFVYLNYKKSNTTDTSILIDIDTFVQNKIEIDSIDLQDFNFIQRDGQSIWQPTSMDTLTNTLYLSLVKKESEYYMRLVARYKGNEEIILKNVYINSNLIPKATILEVKNDNYLSKKERYTYIEEAFFDTKLSENIAISNYLDNDSIKVVLMGFKKNVSFILSKKQQKSLNQFYEQINYIIH